MSAPPTYSSYLRIPELLELQVPRSSPPHHDELLFIIIHQTFELWFRLVLHELETAIDLMDQGAILRAHHFVRRVVAIERLLIEQIHILETMTPIEFLGFRERLNPASGLQSVQFREIEIISGLKDPRLLGLFASRPEELSILRERMDRPDLRCSFYGLLRRLGLPMPDARDLAAADDDPAAREVILKTLVALYSTPEANLELYLLSEALVEYDEYFSLWRHHHVKVVERIIGPKPGTGGSEGVAYLQTTLEKRCLPLLWQVRTRLGAPAPRAT